MCLFPVARLLSRLAVWPAACCGRAAGRLRAIYARRGGGGLILEYLLPLFSLSVGDSHACCVLCGAYGPVDLVGGVGIFFALASASFRCYSVGLIWYFGVPNTDQRRADKLLSVDALMGTKEKLVVTVVVSVTSLAVGECVLYFSLSSGSLRQAHLCVCAPRHHLT